MFSLYILERSDRTLYVGHTDNLDERVRQHEAGAMDSYTSTRRPLKVLYVEEFETRYEALARSANSRGEPREEARLHRGRLVFNSKNAKGKHRHERKVLK